MFLYFALLMYPIVLSASLEEPKQFADFPTELLSTIKTQVGTAFLSTHKGTYPQLKTLQQIDTNKIIDDIARKNLFEENYDLNVFSKGYNKDYENMPDELRPAWNEKYNKLVTDPIFFLKFFRCNIEFFESKKFPDFIASKLVPTEEFIDDVRLSIFTQKENEKAKLILIDYDFSSPPLEEKNRKLEACIQKIMDSYVPCSRIIFKDLFEWNRHAKKILESDRYDSIFSNYIVQDSHSKTVFDDNNSIDEWDLRKISTRNLENYEYINHNILKVKTHKGTIERAGHNCTLLFTYPRKCIELFPNIYVNERDRDGNSALLFQMIWYGIGRNNLDNNYYQWFLKNIRTLVDNGIHIDFFSEPFKNNALHFAVTLNDPNILRILSEGKLFHKALRQRDYLLHTPLDQALTSRERNKNVASFSKKNNLEIIEFLLYNGAVTGLDVHGNRDIFHSISIPESSI